MGGTTVKVGKAVSVGLGVSVDGGWGVHVGGRENGDAVEGGGEIVCPGRLQLITNNKHNTQ
jgi:hypothetical protein